ncbi:MAG: sigma-54-dependent Fis family transcriptional regulator [Proteobacteria bacterium]|nr:sigma-54-dependent Fis family transcriptional regulator [Pseudomonadota bacterium]
MAYEILVVDDEADIRNLISDILQDEGYVVHLASNGANAIEIIKSRRPNLVFLDIWLNDSRFDGIELLDVIKKDHPFVPVIMISGHGTIETAVNTLKKGAYDFIEKPFTVERLLLSVKKALEAADLKRENDALKRRIFDSKDFIGNSIAAQQIRATITKVAQTNSRVMITGPVGSGQEFVARLIHNQSKRAEGPFVVFDCRGHTPESFEEALLGREGDKTAPLIPSTVGMLEEAHNGTLFLDHVSFIPLEAQSKFVRILHDLNFERLGGTKKIRVDVRILSSTTENLAELVKLGKFREDLFYRLNVVNITLPPLNERQEDILLLMDYFLKKANPKALNLPLRSFTEEAKTKLTNYAWPGNVRQVRNVAEWITIVSKDRTEDFLGEDVLPPEIVSGSPSILALDGGEELLKLSLREAREIFERQYLASQIIRFGGNISKTSDFVGMERSALHRKLRSLGLGNQHAAS